MKEKYLEDIEQIRSIMDRSSRFISLSGWSGIVAGVTALVAAYMAYETVYSGQDYMRYRYTVMTADRTLRLLGIATGAVVIAVVAGMYLTQREARRQGLPVWDKHTKRFLVHLAIPLITGGLFCLILLVKGLTGLVAPATLIFYGLALVNASKYTTQEIRSLGVLEVLLGLLGAYFIGYGLIIWALGFGVLHIVYGTIMQIRSSS